MCIFLFSLGVFALLAGLVYRPLKLTSKLVSPKKEVQADIVNALLDKVCQLPAIRSLIRLITKNKSLLINRMSYKELELSEINITIQQLYAVRMITVFACMLIVLSVRATNIEQQKKYLICTSNGGMYGEVVYDEGRYALYCRIDDEVSDKLEINQTRKEQTGIVEAAISQLPAQNEKALIKEKADWYLKTEKKVHNISFFNYKHVLVIAGSFFISDFILLLIWLLRGYSYKREIIKLEYVLELLAGIDGIKTSDIVFELQKASRSYNKYFENFLYKFKSDKRQAFNYLKGSAKNSGMAKLAEVLEIYSLNDKTIALQILERAVMERDEAAVITADETLDIVDLIAFASVVPLIYEIAHLMLSPMLDMIYRAFQYI